ncbi:30S ribosomal protein S3 [Patescibacteria group bacterium]|nr:30S ribosomal protein S3 [Patescibacteria group bacterium]
MGQKINPYSFRLATTKEWKSRWIAKDKTEYKENLLEDIKIRRYLIDKLKMAGLVETQIDRSINKIRIALKVSRPGVVIGRGGSGLEILKKDLCALVSMSDAETNLELDVEEVKDPEISARLVASKVAGQLEQRMPHRRVVSKAIERVMVSGAKGVKIALSGRVAGSEIGRTEVYKQGAIPLQTIRADVDYAQVPSLTRMGYVGVKVWIYKGELNL